MAHGNAIPQHILSTSPVSAYPMRERKDIPLNLLALIISYLDDIADIARITRTSRLLYYMTLPKLYETVTLRSYADIRYFNGRPEGYGSGSPFSMALNGLVTRNVATYVRNWRLLGEWKESDVEEFAKGRVPDNSMMLNVVIRAAMDKMTGLESFGWELNTKPLQTVYQGLALRSSLTSLTIKFPSTRIPRPTVLIPPMPNLRSFTATDIDPLCYPDDISLLLLHSRRLEELKLQWSPRMREEGEPSTHLQTYFGRVMASSYRIPLKRVSLKNLYARNDLEFEQAIELDCLEALSFINCVDTKDPMTVFIDESWMKAPRPALNLKSMRGDGLDKTHVNLLGTFSGLEGLYFINAKKKPPSRSSSKGVTPSGASPMVPSASSGSGISAQQENINLASDYIAVITTNHGATLRNLLLSDQWQLGGEVIARLVRSCPNLEQLGLAIEENNMELLRLLLPFAPKLYAVRILINPAEPLWETVRNIDDSFHAAILARELYRSEFWNLKYIGLGESIFEVGGVVQGKKERVVRPVTRKDVAHVEIWGLDTLDI